MNQIIVLGIWPAGLMPTSQTVIDQGSFMGVLNVSFESGIATLALDNPPQNRLNSEVFAGLAGAAQAIGERGDVRVVLIRSEGPNFSFGGDITGWLEMDEKEVDMTLRGALAAFNAFETLPVPVIAAVQGMCMGGGFELALRCDVIIAADDAKFGHPEQTLGLVTLLGGVQRVAERAGLTKAMRWGLTSELVSATVMAESDVITESVPAADLPAATDAWVTRLASGPTLAHAGHKRLLRAWASGGAEAADALLPDVVGELMQSDDARLGISSAIEALAAGKARPSVDFAGA